MADEEREQFYETSRLVPKETKPVDREQSHLQLSGDRYSGHIDFTFETLQPVHVGTGVLVPPQEIGVESDAPLVKGFHQIDGRLAVPGSSLKGAVRSFVEAITASCVNKTGHYGTRRSDAYGECRYNARRRQGKLCPACQMVGAMGYQGQVLFADALLVQGASEVHFIPAQYQPSGERSRRYYAHDLQDDRERTWPLEVAGVGSRFSSRLRFQNLTAGQLGLLLLALGQGQPPICLKLGAGKSAGLGAVRFVDVQARQLDVRNLYTAYDSDQAWQDVDAAAMLAAADDELLRKDSDARQMLDELDCGKFAG